MDLKGWKIQGIRRLFGAIRLRLYCVMSRGGCVLFLVVAGLLETKSNIGKLKKTRAGGDTAKPVFPGAFASRSFEAIAWSDPQPVGVIGDFGLL